VTINFLIKALLHELAIPRGLYSEEGLKMFWNKVLRISGHERKK
jgi:hypothetical protein